MAKDKADLLQGTLDMLILKSLSLGELHGYGIIQRIRQLSMKCSTSNRARCIRRSIALNKRDGCRRAGTFMKPDARRSLLQTHAQRT